MGANQTFRLILASSSPARRYLLERAGYQFDVKPAHIDEPTHAGYPSPRHLVQHIAWLKAAAVAPTTVEEGMVLAADTVGWLDGVVLGKPADETDARRILRFLGGRVHELWTGVCLWSRPDDVQTAWQERTLVRFKALSEGELDGYIASRQWENNAGAYAIKEDGDPFIEIVEGSITNVIGLPMETTSTLLRLFGERSLPMRNSTSWFFPSLHASSATPPD
jgi:septum formation protein